MENTARPRSLLKAGTYWLIISIAIWIWYLILHNCLPAPGAQDAPVNSRSGKVDCLHPGPSFSSLNFFEHNVYFLNWDGDKLISGFTVLPASRTINRILYCISQANSGSFNIIYIIKQSAAIYSSVCSYPQFNIVIHIPGLRTQPGLGDDLKSRTTELVLELKSKCVSAENEQQRLILV